MKVPGEGMPVFEGHGHGDLFIEFNVVLPERISPELRKSKLVADSGSLPSLIIRPRRTRGCIHGRWQMDKG